MSLVKQRRQPGHPLVGRSPIRSEFGANGADAYVQAWRRWLAQCNAYRREERLWGDEYQVAMRNKLERLPEDVRAIAIRAAEEAGLLTGHVVR